MRRLLLPLTLVLCLAVAGSATAASDLEIGIADDGVTQRTPELAPQVIPEWKKAGTDVARVLVIWHYVAPFANRTTRPAGFDPADPADPAYNWGPIDRVVDLLRAQGIEPLLNVTGWSPVWGTLDPSRRDQRYKPDPAQFAKFATAVAGRYGSRVDRYILWNEPNLRQWMRPLFQCTGSSCVASAAHQYRAIARAAIPAIKAADPGAKVYGPAVSSKGENPRSGAQQMRPLQFLRALGCVDAKLRPDRRSRPCKNFKPVSFDGIAYHPHSTLSSPAQGYAHRDDANLADYARLVKAVDAIQKAGGILNDGSRSRRFDFFFDEYGYQTNPPDPYLGVTVAQQSLWLQQAAFVAYRLPRVRMLVQYLWRDDPVRSTGSGQRDYSGWQSGLYYYDGRKKPARDTFPNPFWVDLPKGSRQATVWGQVRPGDAAQVTVERRTTSATFSTLRALTTDARGYFRFTTTVNAKATFRFRYPDADGKTVTSSSMTVKPARRG